MIEIGLALPDIHVPYHDKQAWRLVLDVAKRIKPAFCIQGGDWFDFKSVNMHGLKAKERALMLADELPECRKAVQELTSALPTNCRKYFTEGNHETRLKRYIDKNAPALSGSIDYIKDTGLKECGWRVTPYAKRLKLDHVVLSHNFKERAGENAARLAMLDVWGNAITFHTHRMGVSYRGSLSGAHFGAQFGWLGSHEAHYDYKDEVGGEIDTVLGFGVIYRHVASRCWWVHAVPIIDYKCVVPVQPIVFG